MTFIDKTTLLKMQGFYHLFLNLMKQITFTINFVDAYQDCIHLFLIGNIYNNYSGYNGGGKQLSRRLLVGKSFSVPNKKILSLLRDIVLGIFLFSLVVW